MDLSSTASIETDAPPTIELVHVDPAAPHELRRTSGLLSLLEDVEHSAADDVAVRSAREVFRVLTRAGVSDVAMVGDALASGGGSDGGFVPPVMVIGGELELGFSDVEVLRAAISALSPLLPTDPNAAAAERALIETVMIAEAWLGRQTDGGSSSVAEALAARLRDVIARGTRLVPPGYVEAHTERTALERRAYQTRPVLGDRFIRGRLVSPASSAAVPVYLPMACASRMPLFRQFSAHLLVEVHPRQDQYEGHPACLKVLALARRFGKAPGASRSTS